MIIKLAVRNLFHDRARFLVTLVGILFAVLLVAIQLGMFFGARQMITAMVEHANGDIWIGAYGADSIEQGLPLTGRERYVALSVPGVRVRIAACSFRLPNGANPTRAPRMSSWSAPTGTRTALTPWNVVEGKRFPGIAQWRRSSTAAMRMRLEFPASARSAEIEGHPVRVEGMTDGIRSFTTSPYIFTSLSRAHELTSIPADQANFYLVKLAPGADAAGGEAGASIAPGQGVRFYEGGVPAAEPQILAVRHGRRRGASGRNRCSALSSASSSSRRPFIQAQRIT